MRTTAEKLELFRQFFTGLPNVYGTYDLATGKARQVKQAVTDAVFLAHLQGKRPYGVYLLDGEHTCAVVADFDVDDIELPMAFVAGAAHYGLDAHIERSKSKGYHVWMFLNEAGVSAAKARRVVRHILAEINESDTEVFPKHDRLGTDAPYGNYIYAPLFGLLVPEGRTVYLDPTRGLTPFADQWAFLETVVRIKEEQLDQIIELNELQSPTETSVSPAPLPGAEFARTFGLLPCAQRMLTEGVTRFQRVSCFRLAVQLKKTGLARDLVVAVLKAWAKKNRPLSQRTMTEAEIIEQTSGAYAKDYRSCGCEDPAVTPFCTSDCRLFPDGADGKESSPAEAEQ